MVWPSEAVVLLNISSLLCYLKYQKGKREVITVAKPPWSGAAVSETCYVQTLKL